MALALAPLSSAAVGFENYLLSATLLSYTSQYSATYPASNLAQIHRSAQWWSSAIGSQQQFIFDLGQQRTPNAFALVDPNCDAGKTVTIEFSPLSDTWSSEYLDLTTYAIGTPGILRWYFTGAAARQFMRVTLPASWADAAYHKCGLFWLGSMTEMDVLATDPELADPSGIAYSDGRAKFADRKRQYHTFKWTTDAGMRFEDVYALKPLAAALGPGFALVDLHANTTDNLMRAEGTFYASLADRRGFSYSLVTPTQNSATFQWEEAAG